MGSAEERLVHVLESQGLRELVSAHLFATGVALDPTIDDKHMLADHAREELGHFEVVATLYEQVTGRGLYDVVFPRASGVPSPASWLEAAVAGYLVDRSAAVQLAEYKKLGDARLLAIIDEILEYEQEHLAAAETAILDQCRGSAEVARAAQAHVTRWFRIARELIDPGTDQARVASDFELAVRPTVLACGLSLPEAPP